MKKAVFLTVLFFLFPVLCVAQEINTSPAEPKTELEKFSSKSGEVIVRGFEQIGVVRGEYSTSIEVVANHYMNKNNDDEAFGITITVQEEDGRYSKSERSYIDYDEIESLIEGIKYIAKVNRESTKLRDFQADYKTRGDFTISTFNNRGKTMISAKSGVIREVNSYFPIAKMDMILEMIVVAKSRLDEIKK